MIKKCQYCKKPMTVPSWFFCNQQGCLAANAKKHHEKRKGDKEYSNRTFSKYDQKRATVLVSSKPKKFRFT